DLDADRRGDKSRRGGRRENRLGTRNSFPPRFRSLHLLCYRPPEAGGGRCLNQTRIDQRGCVMDNVAKLNLEKIEVQIDGKEPGLFTKLAVSIRRARVPGGWLVFTAGNEGMNGVTFYAEPEHRWDGGSVSQ